MLGIILIVLIGKQFYKLAEEHNQNKWLFGILGALSYYLGAFIGGIILAVTDEFVSLGIDWDNNLLMTFVAIPFSLGTVYIFYYLLKKNWKNTVVPLDSNEIQDIGKNTEELEEEN